ncbi:hypothetical protein CONPUDRAFT_94012 [Coniophora puteana RWD-64-598 SS2]|uniref:DUF6533 domain-containing protein n=1 Tax=Coniophora puteana (strain RWD-64-598) TaxID=741705 RepID=R7SEI5_CONPW|nr:uncharacterized protein CONPUDRAFT_94012 [Coniophora puteana RWD-64-598 SS2]EIW74255.1 hypothetical protein CONPUDRAFT_94012 [Coniophora puteana RWD-64-598 SS2]
MMMYDYVLSLTLEVKFIWTRKASWATISNVLLRYCGLIFGVLLEGLAIPWSQKVPLVVNLLGMVSEVIVLFFLQGVLAVRIYVLLERPRRLLPILAVGFILSQAMVITTGVIAFIFDSREIELIEVSGKRVFVFHSLSQISVLSPIENGIEGMYEVFLSSLAVYYACKNLRRRAWISPWYSARSLAEVVVRGNIMYFAIAFVQTTLGTIQYVKSVNESTVFWCFFEISLYMWISMSGPWLMLTLRQKHDEDISGGVSDFMELTELRFDRASHHPDDSTTLHDDYAYSEV